MFIHCSALDTEGPLYRSNQMASAAVHCFFVVAAAEPGVMPRILEYFAKRGLVPKRWVSDLIAVGWESELSIDIQIEGLDGETAQHIARCLDELYDVRAVLTSQKMPGEGSALTKSTGGQAVA